MPCSMPSLNMSIILGYLSGWCKSKLQIAVFAIAFNEKKLELLHQPDTSCEAAVSPVSPATLRRYFATQRD